MAYSLIHSGYSRPFNRGPRISSSEYLRCDKHINPVNKTGSYKAVIKGPSPFDQNTVDPLSGCSDPIKVMITPYFIHSTE